MSTKIKSLKFILLIIFWISVSGMTGYHAPLNSTSPVVKINNVVANTSVQFRAQNFPAHVYVEVLIGAHGTRGVNGVNVGTFITSNSGSLRTSVGIPSRFNGSAQLDLRVQRKGYNDLSHPNMYADVTFTNTNSSGRSQRKICPANIQVTNVVRRQSVTVTFSNLPANVVFTTRMTALENLLNNLQVVGTFNTGAGGSLVLTFNIPHSLSRTRSILLIIDNQASNYFCLTAFKN